MCFLSSLDRPDKFLHCLEYKDIDNTLNHPIGVGKVFPVHVLKENRGSRFIPPLILKLSTGRNHNVWLLYSLVTI